MRFVKKNKYWDIREKTRRSLRWNYSGTSVLELNSFQKPVWEVICLQSKSLLSPERRMTDHTCISMNGLLCWNQSFVQQLRHFSVNNMVKNQIVQDGRHSTTKVWLYKNLYSNRTEKSSDSPSVVPGLAALVSPGNLLAMHIIRTCPKLTESKPGGGASKGGRSIYALIRRIWCMLKFENLCTRP